MSSFYARLALSQKTQRAQLRADQMVRYRRGRPARLLAGLDLNLLPARTLNRVYAVVVLNKG